MNNRIYFVLWLFNRLLFRADEYQSRHSSKPLTVGCKVDTTYFETSLTLTNKIFFITFFTLTVLISSVSNLYGQSQNLNHVNSDFEVTLVNSDYSLAYSVYIVLTQKKLDIVFKSGLVGGKDSLLFSTPVQPSDTLQELSNLDISQLKPYYSNDCISDGTQITIDVKKNSVTKTVHLSNYYQEDIGKMIYLMNSLVPDKYRVLYDKKQLKAYDKLCNGTN